MSAQSQPPLHEVFTTSESFDSPVFREFRGSNYHRAADTATYDAARMAADLGDYLTRSRQELLVSPSGTTRKLFWSSLLFELPDRIFIVMHLKTNRFGNERESMDVYEVVVSAPSPILAAKKLGELRKLYSESVDESGAAFFVLTSTNGRLQRASLENSWLLDEQSLALHYGEGMPAWTEEFMHGLSEGGLSLLRGEPGTGKTSFLRHTMLALAATHRFYFVPVDSFDILSSSSLAEFWRKQQRDHPQAKKVLVLEDAEALLMNRSGSKSGGISAILNVSDGLMKQVVQAHVLCTLNCSVDELDKAALRPGRLKFFREFERIPEARALALAQRQGISLPEQKDYTLADIFAGSGFERRAQGVKSKPKEVGFAPR
jgi:hypothetical protein